MKTTKNSSRKWCLMKTMNQQKMKLRLLKKSKWTITLKPIKLWIIFSRATIVNFGRAMFLKDTVINLQTRLSLGLLIVIKLITTMIGLAETSKKLARMTQWSMIPLLKWLPTRLIWAHRGKMSIKIYHQLELK